MALDQPAAQSALHWLAAAEAPLDASARITLAALHLIDPDGDALLDVHAPYAEAAHQHARRALAACEAFHALPASAGDTLPGAVRRAAALWNARLFFEVHEVLEARWKHTVGNERDALQGWIQIAVAYYHLTHDNPRGARTLLHEGRARLEQVPATTLPELDVARLLQSTAALATALAARSVPPHAEPPVVVLDTTRR